MKKTFALAVALPMSTFSDKKLEWAKMLPTYGTRKNVTGTQEQQDAVAKLMRLVGQSVSMNYSTGIGQWLAHECGGKGSALQNDVWNLLLHSSRPRLHRQYDKGVAEVRSQNL